MTDLREALKPFAEFAEASGFDKLPDDMPMTQGSRLARKQVTAGDFKRARAALLAHSIPERGKLGPRPVGLSCKGCPAHVANRWREPSGDGETYDSGTEAKCAAADNREISTYYGAEPPVPDWCPALPSTPAPVRGVDVCPPSSQSSSSGKQGSRSDQAAMGDE